jgi:hypothetical protein
MKGATKGEERREEREEMRRGVPERVLRDREPGSFP